MPRNNYFKIGLFVLAGCGLFLAGLLSFGLRDKMFSSNVRCVTLFGRTVQGLSADAAVKFRGFAVGRVTAISLAQADDSDGQPLVQVNFEINPAMLAAQLKAPDEAPAFLRREITRGLKVYLTLQGVTGICFLDLDYGQENAPLDPAGLAATEAMSRRQSLVYIPNGPSQILEIGEAVSRLVRTMNEIDFLSLSRDIKRTLLTVDEAVAGLDTARLSRDLEAALTEIGSLAASLRLVSGHLESLTNTGEEGSLGRSLEASARQMRQTLKRLDQLMGSSRGGLPETMDNLRAMSENLREMSELLKAQPSQALFGRPPRKSNPARSAGPDGVTTFTVK